MENNTVDAAGLAPPGKGAPKKSRSKSIGLGGLDALNEISGNRGEAAAATFVKSILKPSIPLSSPKQIPPHMKARGKSASPRKPSAQASPQRQKPSVQEGFLIDTSDGIDSGSLPVGTFANSLVAMSMNGENLLVPEPSTQVPSVITVRTEEEQQAAAREKETTARKDARRKSLANRRVSFAPEATLHTWNVFEMAEDSTTSSASGNSTRRASALSTMGASPMPQHRSPVSRSDTLEPPSTSPALAEEAQVEATPSPAHQRDLHSKKRRRSSAIPPMNFNDPGEFSSSPCSGSSVHSDDTGSQAFATIDQIDSSDSDDKDLVEDESTVTGVDNEDTTSRSVLSARSSGGSNTSSSGRLDEALRQAAKQAGTQGIEYDEHGEITMEMADDEVTNAFQPWMRKGNYVPQIVGNPSALQDQENINPFSPDFGSSVHFQAENDDGEGTMDITQAAGSILSGLQKSQASPENPRRRSGIAVQRQGSGNRRRSSGASSMHEDETMDLTTAIGGIQNTAIKSSGSQTPNPHYPQSDDDDEELTMDFTTVLGGVLGGGANQHSNADRQNRRESFASSTNDEDMDITFAAGGILSSITERTEPFEDRTMEMDVTQAIGTILPQQADASEKTRAKILMERETDTGQLPMDPFFDGPSSAPRAAALDTSAVIFKPSNTRTSETGSPMKGNLAGVASFQTSMSARHSRTPSKGSRQVTPMKVSTPTKQVTPQIGRRPTTPGKTPPSKNIAMRSASPKKLFAAAKSAAITSPKATNKGSVFNGNGGIGAATPNIVLKPKRRRSSGLGVDKEGLGSPRVTELLDRRGSIHQSAQSFVPNLKAPAAVRFEDPRMMERQIDQERAEDERRENGRGILQTEADSQDTEEQRDVTANLKDKIESLTPQKKKARPRKSLHVGAAKGILGKRPAELDDEEDEDNTTLDRLQGREGSPVKKIKLPAPPSKNEMTRRNLRPARVSLLETMGNARVTTPSMRASPIKGARATTPQGQPRFKNMDNEINTENPMTSFGEKLEAENPVIAELPEAEDRIHLQDFLNMTSIRFMELTTTKRRVTVAPAVFDSEREASTRSDLTGADAELEKAIIAGACTVPMLELYQHVGAYHSLSCRELKRYIAEGRSIVREIEADTYEDNPALFREYMTAPSGVKAIMDNQFKNVKTHARLLSKAMWYEWRMKLLDGLKEGLVQISNGMDEDAENLAQQEGLLEPMLPKLIEENGRLQGEYENLQAQADELASCDQDELRQARDKLRAVDDDLQAKLSLLAQLGQELQAKDESVQDALERRDEYHAEIKEAERVRQDSRGWKPSEVSALQANLAILEETHGWKIISATKSTLTLTYKDTLRLFFTPSSFLKPGSSSTKSSNADENASISLTYIADSHEFHTKPMTTEKRFFLQIIRAQLQCLRQSAVRTDDLLNFITRNWEAALVIAEEVRSLNAQYLTEAVILSDEVMAVKAVLLLKHMRTKLEVSFEVQARGGDGSEGEGESMGTEGLDIAVRSQVRVVYGEELKEGKMAEWVDGRLEEDTSWVRAVGKLEERLKGRSRKQR
ncbi:MAG: hypothetical protein L6R37_001874 [Teloschistes peruensis]|nr:MAG: hypothetical protein L6R37_001874 [Teloschistes peruensis]